MKDQHRESDIIWDIETLALEIGYNLAAKFVERLEADKKLDDILNHRYLERPINKPKKNWKE